MIGHKNARHEAEAVVSNTRLARPGLPDPLKPSPIAMMPRLIGCSNGPQFTPHEIHQRHVRARIFAETRALLGEEGYEGLTLQRLADRCDLSKGTVYNLVGDKKTVLAGALLDNFDLIAAIAQSVESGPSAMLQLAEFYCRLLEDYPAYTRAALLAIMERNRPVGEKLKSSKAKTLRGWLRRQRHDGQLRRGVDIGTTAMQLSLIGDANMRNWLYGACSTDELRHGLLTAYGLVFLGATDSSEMPNIESWLQRHEVFI